MSDPVPAPPPQADAPAYTVAVRALCEFAAKAGDLDLRFTPAPTALEGMAGHAEVALRRGEGYVRELSLEGRHGPLRVRGRADGWDAARGRLEEVKTHRGPLDRQPANHRALHWAQAKVYGWLQCQRLGLEAIEVALVYYDVGSGRETVLAESHTAAALQAFFEALCERFTGWARQEAAHRQARDTALQALNFVHPHFRAGQRTLATATYQAQRAGRCLMVQAPTGIGKTLGTVFPVLKAMPLHGIDKLFFLAAKTPGRALALHALQALAGPEAGGTVPRAPLRVLELTARDKACEHPDLACHGASCPLAAGFYDRLPAARAQAVAGTQPLDSGRVRTVALDHGICPYYLSQELVRWADVVVGDYNYWFDLGGLLHGLAQAQDWRASVLVDEAHNLVERARSMYSATLEPASLTAARKAAPAGIARALGRLQKQWGLLHGDAEADAGASEDSAGTGPDYRVHDAPPAAFLAALQQATGSIGEHLVEHPEALGPELQAFYFDALHFTRMAELFGPHSLFDTTRAARAAAGAGRGAHAAITPCLRNVVPAPFLAPRFAAAHATVLFSATLSPAEFQTETLGLPAGTPWIDVASPFDPAQLQVRIARHISTRWADRAASLAPIAALMGRQFADAPGNYLAFFSSHDYLQQALTRFVAQHPDVPVWQQDRRMDESVRAAFLARFVAGGQGIGFAVLGGAFAEGIDLPGDRLVGAFIATLGLPQVNPVNEQMRARMQATFGDGYAATYLYPGLQKVVQAAGRVIRTASDRGVVHLMDDRFARAEVRALLPGWWQI